MDKTFNDLMDIVNRTKKLDGSDRPRPRPAPRQRVEEDEEEYSPREYDIVEEKPKRTRTTKKDSPDLFAGSAVEKLVKNTAKPSTKKATTTKKSTTTKKTTTKSTTKSTPKAETNKKPTTPKVSKPKLTKDDVLSEIQVKLDKPKAKAKETSMSSVNASDPKNAQLYEALKNSLFSGGTDISEYMEMQENSDARASLQELKAKREAHKINEEITKEQQEYEQLFNGSFESQYENSQLENFEEDEENGDKNVNVAEKNARLANELNAIRNNLEQKKNNPNSISQVATATNNKKDETYELETGNRDLDRKIAEYYKRKQEKINEYNAREEEGIVEESRTQDDGPVDYEAIFGGSMMSRDELLGIERDEPQEEVEESVEETLEKIEPQEKMETSTKESSEENVENFENTESIESVENETLRENTVDEVLSETDIATSNENNSLETLEEVSEDDIEEDNSYSQEVLDEMAPIVEEQTTADEQVTEEQVTEEQPTVEEQLNEDDQSTEGVDDQSTESAEEHKESHIKSLLSDLLFSKKIYPTENKVEDNKTEEPIESEEVELHLNNDIEDSVENVEEKDSSVEMVEENAQTSKADYESIWNKTFLSGVGRDESNSSEESQEELQKEEKQTQNGEQPTTYEQPGRDDVETSSEENSQEDTQEDTQEDLSDEELLDSLSLNIGKESTENVVENTTENEDTIDSQAYQPILDSDTEEENQESDSADILDGQEGFLPEDIQKAQSFEDEEIVGVEKLDDNADNMYDLSSRDAGLDDYILTSNMPSEESTYTSDIPSAVVEENEDAPLENISNKIELDDIQSNDDIEEMSDTHSDGGYDEHFESIVNNERLYENTQKNDYLLMDDDPEDNTCVVETLPENRYDLFGNAVVGEEEEKETREEKKDDTISKEEFYNEMARLQENLINQLKGNATTESRDFFAEKDPEEEKEIEEKADKLVDDIIDEFDRDNVEENNVDEDMQENEDMPEDSIEEIEEPICKAEPVDPEHYDDYNLLGKEEPLNDEDLEFQVKSEEEKVPEKDAYFYLSPEDNEKKAQEVDEYVQLFNEDTVQKEVGDIHIFKTIGNASPSSEILKDLTSVEEQKVEEENRGEDEEVEAIYTLMGIERKPIAKAQPDMKVLYVASECQPFVASGGLGDVAGSLPKAIARKGGVDIRVILPLYSSIKSQYRDKFEYLGNFTVHLSWRQEYCGLFRYYKDGVTYYFVDNERYFKRDNLYGYYDDGERFAYFSKAVVEALPYLNFFPDIIHCNDWQSSLVSAYIKTGNWSDFRYYKIKNIYTIHNVEYQGVYGMENLKDLFGIDSRFRNDMEYNGDINLTKSAIQFSDKFTTVSKSYCENLKQPYCSRGLHHIIIRNEYKLSGIVNGIDYDFYNPATDTSLFKNYDFGCIEDKILNKKSWQDEMGLPVDGNTPMIAIVSRLVNHKGIDLVMKVMEEILDNDVQLVVVGTGDEKYVGYFKYLEGKYPTKVRALVDEYSNENARKAYASSDIFLMPSKIEPCGISQMIASRYGCVPIVREVGGLKDTIRDFGCEGGGNGYTFTNYNPNDLKYQLNRAIRDYENRSGWREKMKICMSVDFTWDRPAEEYIKLYKSLYETM